MRDVAICEERVVTICQKTGKHAHDYDGAVRHMRALQIRQKAKDLNVYQCDSHWHVGHSRQLFNDRLRRALSSGRTRRRRGGMK